MPSDLKLPGPRIGIGRTAEVYAWGEGQILKLYYAEIPAEWVYHEAKVGRIVAEAGLSAPAIGDALEVDGRLGILYERIDGRSQLELLARQPWMLPRFARQFAAVHVAMHNTPGSGLPSQRAALIRAIEHAPRLAEASKARILTILGTLADGDVVCHGDYHPGNVVQARRGPVVIDWMTASCGNAITDVAWTTLLFRLAALPPGISPVQRVMLTAIRRTFLAAYLRAYRQLRPFPIADLEPWLPILAAARLSERIAAEEEGLVALAETAGRASP